MVDTEKEISKLPPSADLLEFYRRRIQEYDETKDDLVALLDKYKKLVHSPEERKEREKMVEDLSELKDALSDLNVYIHAERQQVSRLQFENRKLMTEQKFMKQKINFLLLLSNISEDQLNAYLRSSKKKEILEQICTRKKRKIFCDTLNCLKDSEPSEIEVFLNNKLQVLNDHFKSTETLWNEEKVALLEERNLQKAEAKAQREADQAHIGLLNAKFNDSQKLLEEATRKAIESKTEMMKSKNKWLAEKDKLAMDLRRIRTLDYENLNAIPVSELCEDLKSMKAVCQLKQMRKANSLLKKELQKVEELRSIDEARCKKFEEEIVILSHQLESQNAVFKNKIKRLEESKELFRRQRDKIEERRKKQMEGFYSELKLVRNDLRKVVQQFFKLTSYYCESKEVPDISEIKDLQLATSLARNIHHAIIKAKRSMMSMESNYIKEE
ncbi:UNVERIFIED_CONTAM: hypothetical protein RMT77_007611 [Armadillidium vulgare]